MTEHLAPIEPTNARERELRDRAVRDYGAFLGVGLETGATFFPPGTEVGSLWAKDIAKGKIARARREAERCPEAHDALAALTDNVLSEDRQVAAEVGPAADAGARAVQQQQRRPVAGHVVVQLPLRGVEEPAGLLERHQVGHWPATFPMSRDGLSARWRPAM